MHTPPRYFTACLLILIVALSSPAYSQCTKDVDCKGDRVCVSGTCVDPAGSRASGPGKTLSRSRASQLIAEQQRLPRPQTVTLAGSYLKRQWSNPVVGFGKVTVCVHEGDKFADVEQRLKYYQSQGLITIDFERVEGECPGLWAKVTLTEAGKKYVMTDAGDTHKVRLWTLAMGDVTGIQANAQFQIAEADYKLKSVDITPFGAHVRATSVPEKATFRLFDDGWRIEPDSLNFAEVSYYNLPQTPELQEASRAVDAAAAAAESAIGSGRPSTAEAAGSGRLQARRAQSPEGLYVCEGGTQIELHKDGTYFDKYPNATIRGRFRIDGENLTFFSSGSPMKARFDGIAITFIPNGNRCKKQGVSE